MGDKILKEKTENKNRSRLFMAIKRNTLATEMGLVLVAVLFVFGVTFLISTMAVTREGRMNSEIRESETVINSLAGNIRGSIDNYKDLSRLIMLNDRVTTFLRADEVSVGMINDAKYGAMDVLNVSTNLDSVFILRNDGAYMSTGRGEYEISFSKLDDIDWMAPILTRRGGAVILMNAGGVIHRKDGKPVITVARAIYDIYTQKKTGILLMNISTKMFDEMADVNSNSEIAILSSAGELISGDESISNHFSFGNPLGKTSCKEYKSGRSYKMISTYVFDDLPIVIMCSSVADTNSSLSNTTLIVLLALLATFIVTMLAYAYFVNRTVNKPIYGLVKAMEKTKENGWIEKIEMDAPKNEIGTLVDSYNSMIEYLNDLFTKLIENEKSVQRAEMRVLHEQIKPHFLYNSLGTISYMAYDAGATDVYNALETLGSFYRNFLSKGDRDITVRREITIIKDYLALQKLRYGDILEDEYDIAPEIMERMVPKLMLQPLVENCIYHGIRPKGEPGIIKISGREEENCLVLSVYDTGLGMSEEAIAKALSLEKDNPDADKDAIEHTLSIPSGFGLKGTIERIRYYCNRDDVVTINSEEGEYTEIIIRIPYETREVEAKDVQSDGN